MVGFLFCFFLLPEGFTHSAQISKGNRWSITPPRNVSPIERLIEEVKIIESFWLVARMVAEICFKIPPFPADLTFSRGELFLAVALYNGVVTGGESINFVHVPFDTKRSGAHPWGLFALLNVINGADRAREAYRGIGLHWDPRMKVSVAQFGRFFFFFFKTDRCRSRGDRNGSTEIEAH